MHKNKIGLVLGGGGARGLAHIGVLKVLQENGIRPDVIVGTSMGSLVAAVYAQHPDAHDVERRFLDFLKSDQFVSIGVQQFKQKNVFEPEDLLTQLSRQFRRRVVINLAAHRKSLLKNKRLGLAIENLVNPGNIEDTKIPFACAAVDLNRGEDKIFYRGNIHRAINASSAIPGFIPPVEYKDYQLVDGSVSLNFPIVAAKQLGAGIIIVSNVSSVFDTSLNADNVVDIIMRSHQVTMKKLNNTQLSEADYVINPPVGGVHWAEFDKFQELILSGSKETKYVVENVKTLIRRRSGMWYKFKKWLRDWFFHYVQQRV